MNKNKKRFSHHHKTTPVLFTFKLSEEGSLLEYLYSKIKVVPKGKIKSFLVHRQVLVNGVPVTRYDYHLSKDDEIKIVKTAHKDSRIIKLPFAVLYEDDELIVIDKPSGLLSIASDKENKKTAYRFVSDYVYNHNRHNRIYVVHRLDEDTSGVLIFAKNPKIKDALQNNWNELVKKRGYYAIVEGIMEKKEDTLINYLNKSSVNLVYVTKDKKNGKKAITHYKVINETKEYSLLNVNIETGRQNQIRVQLGNINHFVLGDDKYGEPPNPLHRLALHAYLIEIIHPFTKKLLRFNSAMPKEFKILIPSKL